MTSQLPLTHNLMIVAILGTALGCTDLSNPTGPAQDPEPQFASVCDLSVTTRYIEVKGSCDSLNGHPSAREFQYKFTVSGEGQNRTEQSSGYNKVSGKSYQKAPGGEIDFTNKTMTWKGLSKSAAINVKLYGAEWDGVRKDSRMANRSGSKAVPFGLGKEKRTVVIGANPVCQIRLHYYATWTERKIPVS